MASVPHARETGCAEHRVLDGPQRLCAGKELGESEISVPDVFPEVGPMRVADRLNRVRSNKNDLCVTGIAVLGLGLEMGDECVVLRT